MNISGRRVRDLIVFLWFLALASAPDSEAVVSAADLSGYGFVKVGARVLLLLTCLVYLSALSKHRKLALPRVLVVPAMYVLLNGVLTVGSANFFYSSYRLFEFSLVWLSAYLIVESAQSLSELEERIARFYAICILAMAATLAVFLVSPDLGGKFSGVSAETGEATYRLGGSFLRVDLISLLAGSALLYSVTAIRASHYRDSQRFAKWWKLGLCVAVATLILSGSRTVLGLAILIALATLVRLGRVKLLVGVLGSGAAMLLVNADLVVRLLTRGADFRELWQLNGRLALWKAVLESNETTSLVLGNGYLMNGPNGLAFFVPEFGRFMMSPHNGYLTVLLGSGIVGLVLVAIAYWRYVSGIKMVSSRESRVMFLSQFLLLTLATVMDYGIWGVTSPAMLVFALLYCAVFKVRRVSHAE